MFGKNPVRGKDYNPNGSLRVQSIFYTIQGEGPYTGMPAVFVRLAGCNLACWFCDTDFESNYAQPPQSVEEVIAGIQSFPHFGKKAKLVVLTGGEPMRQNIVPLCRALDERGYKVQIETAGTLWPPGLHDTNAVVVVSPKTPIVHQMVRRYSYCWKYIIKAGETSEEDGLPNVPTQAQVKTYKPLARPGVQCLRDRIFVQPCDEQNEEKNEANRQECLRVAMQYGYRISLQMHKLLKVE